VGYEDSAFTFLFKTQGISNERVQRSMSDSGRLAMVVMKSASPAACSTVLFLMVLYGKAITLILPLGLSVVQDLSSAEERRLCLVIQQL
jgi:hypothetical protein